MGRCFGAELSLIEATIRGNDARKIRMAEKILETVRDVQNPKIAVLGTAFKGGTDDCRESPAMQIIEVLLQKGASVTAYDPKALENAKRILGDRIGYASDMYQAAEGADVLAILTEWEDFKALDLSRLKAEMARAYLVDLRHLIDPEKARKAGFVFKAIGAKD
jgi:UDPglucose 6-dehydrogenase